ncbi:hypothetical protein GCM10022254_31040 [Actinomadura meridiana]|uniref:Uncharacterized protein n=1 Tax=Actinomadura meridiana TaxID=559626 RepID=A0ABP8C1I8_9ACTN
MADPTGRPLDELAVELVARECRAQVQSGALIVALGASGGVQRVIATDGNRFRWGSDHGNDLGPIDDVAGAAARVLSVLSGGRRERGCAS